MVYVFDIDGTICNSTKKDYSDAVPIEKRIKIINKLYEEGNTIFFLTARGMGRSNNNFDYANSTFYNLTKNQLDYWGVKYHALFLGKPYGDIYVDDKGMKDDEFFTDETCS